MSLWKIYKRKQFIKDLELKIIKTKSSIEEIHQVFQKPYTKKKAIELDELCFKLCIYLKALNRIKKWK